MSTPRTNPRPVTKQHMPPCDHDECGPTGCKRTAVRETIALVVDVKQRRPACVIIQALQGHRDPTGTVSRLFDPHTWLTSPTPDMRVVEGTEEQWRAFAKECNARCQKE